MHTDLSKYFINAYKVFEAQKESALVAKIAAEIADKVSIPRDVVVKRSFFEKLAVIHPEISKEVTFNFVKVLNLQSEIFFYPSEQKLKYFQSLGNGFIGFVSIGLDHTGKHMNMITAYPTNKVKWVQNAKSTGIPMLPASSGRTPRPPSLS